MKYAIKMGLGVMIYIPSFRKIGSGIQKWIGEYIDTQTARWYHEPAFIFFRNKKSRLKWLSIIVIFFFFIAIYKGDGVIWIYCLGLRGASKRILQGSDKGVLFFILQVSWTLSIV
jgi:hypothetical protein